MAEAFNDLTLSADRTARYAEVAVEIASVLDGEPNLTARMATVASMLAPKKPAVTSVGAPKAPPLQALDENGNIPDGVGNSNVRAFANRLLHGADAEKLKGGKGLAPAITLAQQFGYDPQGLFNPKEMMQLNLSERYLTEARKNPALAVLDDEGSRLKLQQVMRNQMGGASFADFISRGGTFMATGTETPKEAEFVRSLNQLIGTIAGLRQLTQSGKGTEAGMNRLMLELPNPLSTSSSADAKARLDRLLDEVKFAKNTGKIPDAPAPAAEAVIYAIDPAGKKHKAPTGTPLPPGWKLAPK